MLMRMGTALPRPYIELHQTQHFPRLTLPLRFSPFSANN